MQTKAEILSLNCSFFYSFSLSMLNILVPLYAYYLDYSPFVIGVLISAPGVLQLILRLFGGVLSDRLGERRILWFSCSTLGLGALIFIFSNSITTMLIAQIFTGASRSVYWSSSQSYASRINEKKTSHILGRLTSFVSSGQVLGLCFGGLFIGLLGYRVAFILCMALCVVALLFSIFMPEIPKKPNTDKNIASLIVPVIKVFKKRVIYLTGILAFIAAFQQSLINSYYPIFFRELDFGETMAGLLTSIRPIGTIIMGFIFTFFLKRLGQKLLTTLAVSGTGLSMFLTSFLSSSITISVFMFVMGMTLGSVHILYQVIVTNHSSAHERGLFLSASGLFWGVSIMIMPTIFGLLMDYLGTNLTFMVFGGLLFVVGCLTPLLFKLLLEDAITRNSTIN